MAPIIFKRITGYAKLLWRLNISRTIYINLKIFGLRKGLSFPMYFFGPVKLINLSGGIEIKGIIKRGMIQFGCLDENIISTNEPTRINLLGTLIFNGECRFSRATQLLVLTNGALFIGRNAWFGSFLKIVAFQEIRIGDNFMASWECQLFDTDFHFIKDSNTSRISNNCEPVVIGNDVWLGSRVTLLKGTQLPSKCIVAIGSICNRNYREIYPSNILIGGVPAKLLRENVEYINEKDLEKTLFAFFSEENNRKGFYNITV